MSETVDRYCLAHRDPTGRARPQHGDGPSCDLGLLHEEPCVMAVLVPEMQQHGGSAS